VFSSTHWERKLERRRGEKNTGFAVGGKAKRPWKRRKERFRSRRPGKKKKKEGDGRPEKEKNMEGLLI